MEIFKPTIQDQATFSGSVDISGSLTITQNLNVVGELQGAATTASYISLANVDGFADVSSSIEQRISRQELFSGSLNDTFATDQELSDVSGALAFSIANISSDFADITNKPTLISSSNQLAGETIDGDLTITGTVTAQEFHTEFVSASILYDSGSTKFGDSADDTHSFTGSVYVSNGITGTLTGNASTATSASYAASGPFLSSYTETDTLASVTGRGASTTTDISIANGQPKLRLKETDSTNVDKELLVSGGDFYIRNLNDNDTAGTNLLQVDSSGNLSATGGGTFTGNVGIGTTSPLAKLHLNGVNGEALRWGLDNTVYGKLNCGTAGARIDVTGANSGYGLSFSLDDSTKMIILPDGNVGINATTPIDKLTVGLGESQFIAAQNASSNITGSNVWGFGLYEGSTKGGEISLVRDGTNNQMYVGPTVSGQTLRLGYGAKSTGIFITSDGKIGVNTVSPGQKLEINQGDTGNGEIVRMRYNGSYYTDYGSNKINWVGASQTFSFQNNGSTVLYINSSGNVGIGTTLPAGKLEVRYDTTANNQNYIYSDSKTGANSSYNATGLHINAIPSNNTGDTGISYLSLESRYKYLNGNHGTSAFITNTPGTGTSFGDGQIDFFIRNNTAPYTFKNDPSTSNTYWMDPVMTVRSDGAVLKPNQPGFSVFLENSTTTNSDLIFTGVYYNTGNHYSTSSGRFTAPVAGTYFFYWGSILRTTSGTYRLKLHRNGSAYGWPNTNGNIELRGQVAASTSYETNASRVFIHYLNAYDYVQVALTTSPSSVGVYGDEWTYFGGYLLN